MIGRFISRVHISDAAALALRGGSRVRGKRGEPRCRLVWWVGLTGGFEFACGANDDEKEKKKNIKINSESRGTWAISVYNAWQATSMSQLAAFSSSFTRLVLIFHVFLFCLNYFCRFERDGFSDDA